MSCLTDTYKLKSTSTYVFLSTLAQYPLISTLCFQQNKEMIE